ncbi:hypothetical protein FQA47_016393 [Oryzias melastigma]|uniref:Uncharacterized protein n=1 Tax=Oryzias melastigma TaxID=30732 RepID=A0A834C7E3_ORYME|nr:hypothetical protein FQA47_016393 [Oryzias melastigma]
MARLRNEESDPPSGSDDGAIALGRNKQWEKKGGWIKASWSVPIAAGVGVGSYYGRLTEVSALAQGTRRFLTWNWENHEEERRQIDDWGD